MIWRVAKGSICLELGGATRIRQSGFASSELTRGPDGNAALADLEHLGIIKEVTGRRRGRVFSDSRYLAILGEGNAPLPATDSSFGSADT